MLANKVYQTIGNRIRQFLRQLFYGVVYIFSLESFLKLIEVGLVTQKSFHFLLILFWHFLSILVFLGLINCVVRNAEVSKEPVSCNYLLLFRIYICEVALFSGGLLLIEFGDDVRKSIFDPLILLKSPPVCSTLGLHLSQVTR